MDILDRIVRDKKVEVAAKKQVLPQEYLMLSPMMKREGYSLRSGLVNGSGIISEFKRRSPSKQVINQKSSVKEVVGQYQEAGVSGVSVLTDSKYFGGSLDDLIQARNVLSIPILRKDFMIDPYQLVEAKAFGADVILLIGAILTSNEIQDMSKRANELGLEVLLEIHNEEELRKSELSCIDMVGVNNRNLKDFTVDLNTSRRLSKLIPEDKVRISESGISDVEAIRGLRGYGFRGFLIGENFMRTTDPGNEARIFLNQLEHED